ncbi:hypothetical protein T484DRAFT_2526017 [Baffinella frigidus]|nr:hypothetical protein T484DRAFT_2526017 [Cryptophyta sp. CCMP2293]
MGQVVGPHHPQHEGGEVEEAPRPGRQPNPLRNTGRTLSQRTHLPMPFQPTKSTTQNAVLLLV